MLFETLSNFWQDTGLANLAYQNVIMIVVSFIFLYLAIRHGFEPLLLVPIAMGMVQSADQRNVRRGRGDHLVESAAGCWNLDCVLCIKTDYTVDYFPGRRGYDGLRAADRESEISDYGSRGAAGNFLRAMRGGFVRI